MHFLYLLIVHYFELVSTQYVVCTALVHAYQWLVCYLLEESDRKVQEETAKGKSAFGTRNDSQVYYCRTLAIAFMEVCT
jgi:hypothetical protein